MNWKTYVEKKNEQTYALPEGWDSREAVAKELECSPDSVREHLRAGIDSGEIETQTFKVWNKGRKQFVRITAYRKANGDKPDAAGWTAEQLAEAKKMRAAGKSWNQIGAAIGRTGNSVRSKLRR